MTLSIRTKGEKKNQVRSRQIIEKPKWIYYRVPADSFVLNTSAPMIGVKSPRRGNTRMKETERQRKGSLLALRKEKMKKKKLKKKKKRQQQQRQHQPTDHEKRRRMKKKNETHTRTRTRTRSRKNDNKRKIQRRNDRAELPTQRLSYLMIMLRVSWPLLYKVPLMHGRAVIVQGVPKPPSRISYISNIFQKFLKMKNRFAVRRRIFYDNFSRCGIRLCM